MKKIILERDVFSKNGILLLSKGREIELTDETISRLSRRGILNDVLDQAAEKPKSNQTDNMKTQSLKAVEKAEKAEKDKIDIHIFKLGEQLAKKIHFKDKRSMDKAVLLVQELIHNQKDASWYPHYLALSNHIEWVYAHSINLALISCLIGIELNYPEKRMQDLAEVLVMRSWRQDPR